MKRHWLPQALIAGGSIIAMMTTLACKRVEQEPQSVDTLGKQLTVTYDADYYRLITDNKTGCQYIAYSQGGITPRRDPKHVLGGDCPDTPDKPYMSLNSRS